MLSVINQHFIEAVRNNQINKLENLLSQGASIHASDDRALREASRNGHLEIVKFLVTQGANVHANDDEALKESARNGRDDVWQVLSTFIQEEKLLVAASGVMPLVAAVGSMPLLALDSTGLPEKLVNSMDIKKIKKPLLKI